MEKPCNSRGLALGTLLGNVGDAEAAAKPTPTQVARQEIQPYTTVYQNINNAEVDQNGNVTVGGTLVISHTDQSDAANEIRGLVRNHRSGTHDYVRPQ